MAYLDVSDAFDPSFLQEVLILRSVENINQFGRRQPMAPSITSVEAVVTPVSSRLTRDSDYQQADGEIEVTTQYRLRGVTPGYEADRVVLDNADGDPIPLAERYVANSAGFEHYLVSEIKDFSRFGAGFVVATCSLTDIVPQPPIEQEISEC